MTRRRERRAPPQRMQELRGTVTELAPGGDGVLIAAVGGERRAVFVPGVVTGESVRVEADLSRRPAVGRLLEVIEPRPSRVTPACAHVARCGGCDWMHLTTEAQADEHRSLAARVLDVPDVTSHRAIRALGYRARARVHVEAKRGRVTVGMFGRRTREPVDVDTCIVLEPAIEAARRALPALLEGAHGHGEAQLSLSSRVQGAERKAVLDLRWSGELAPVIFGRLELAVQDSAGVLAGARVFAGEVRVPATIGDPTPWIQGADGEPLRLAPGGFSQATEEGNARLARRVTELAREVAGDGDTSCVELYAGAGNLTVLLARHFSVASVESDRDACEAARANLAARGLRARVVESDAGAYVIPPETRLLVLDPPRTGARDVVAAIASRPPRARPRALVYVSCDLPTLARDLRALQAAGYAVHAVETFEMFPQTSHVETVVALVRTGGPPRGGHDA